MCPKQLLLLRERLRGDHPRPLRPRLLREGQRLRPHRELDGQMEVVEGKEEPKLAGSWTLTHSRA